MKAELAQERDRVEREIASWLRKVAHLLGASDDGTVLFAAEFVHGIANRIERGDHRVLQTYDFAPDPLAREELAVMKLRHELRGHHVHADLFVGPRAEELALSGRLVMTAPEWQTFESALTLGAPRVPWCRVVVITEGRKTPA